MNNNNNCFSLDPGADHNTKKRRSKMLTRKPDPNAPKITKPCTECGKKFWSWKALFGHMRCHPDRQWRGINPPPNFRPPLDDDDREVAASLLILAASPGPLRPEEEHKCSVCMRVFSTGQALGGHKRCHRDIINASPLSNFDLNLPLRDDPNAACALDLRLRL